MQGQQYLLLFVVIQPKDRKAKYWNGKVTTQIEHKTINCAFKKRVVLIINTPLCTVPLIQRP